MPKTHPSALNRFLYYPDRLNRLPSSLLSLLGSLQEPALSGILSAVVSEPFRKKRDPNLKDESVDAFFRRRFGPNLADNLISAMIHGIYAGDSRQLSLRAIFPSLYEMEQQKGSVIKGMLFGRKSAKAKQDELDVKRFKSDLPAEMVKLVETSSVWGLAGGLQSLADTLGQRIREQSNCEVLLDSQVDSIQVDNQLGALDVSRLIKDALVLH